MSVLNTYFNVRAVPMIETEVLAHANPVYTGTSSIITHHN